MSRGLILAAPASGSGKTLVTLALLRALRRRGLAVAAAKAGPDYIDAAFLAAAAGSACHNLDLWAMRRDGLGGVLGLLDAAEIVLCEGAMGLFDGIGAAGVASTAELACSIGWPVILVVDAQGLGASVAALAQGYARHRPELAIAGVILNRVGSARHRELLVAALRRGVPEIPLLGAVPRDASLVLPARHLGLVQAAEHGALEAFLDRAAALALETIDIDALMALARPDRLPRSPLPPMVPALGEHIAVARDEAFAFAYPAMLAAWRGAGAALSFFSPLADEAPDAAADAVFLPGGYPELHAGRVAANARFRTGMGEACARGAAIYGECGGYMVLGETLTDAAGTSHAMLGFLPLATSFAERRLHLGYRAARLMVSGPLGAAGACFRGHEFHYATIRAEGPGTPLFAVEDAEGAALGAAGLVAGKVMGSFLHLLDRAD